MFDDENFFEGKSLGKLKNGTVIRSKDDERESFALVCPCKVCSTIIQKLIRKLLQVEKWQVRNKDTWKFDDSIRVMIRRYKKVF